MVKGAKVKGQIFADFIFGPGDKGTSNLSKVGGGSEDYLDVQDHYQKNKQQ